MIHILSRNIAENFRSLGIKAEHHLWASQSVAAHTRSGDMLPGQLGFLLDQITRHIPAIPQFMRVTHKFISRLSHPLKDETITIRMDQSYFQIGCLFNVLTRTILFRVRKAGQLNQNLIVPLRLNNWLRDTQFIHSFAQHSHGLGQ